MLGIAGRLCNALFYLYMYIVDFILQDLLVVITQESNGIVSPSKIFQRYYIKHEKRGMFYFPIYIWLVLTMEMKLNMLNMHALFWLFKKIYWKDQGFLPFTYIEIETCVMNYLWSSCQVYILYQLTTEFAPFSNFLQP